MRGACTSIRWPRSIRSRASLVLSVFFSVCLASASVSWPATYTDKYDAAIKECVGRWLPAYPSWKRAKAQLIQESGLRPNVCSAVGACGLGQFMPGTWSDVGVALKWGRDVSRFDPEISIEAYCWYQGRLFNQWRARRPVEDRISLAESSYNAGLGWILEAQRRCGNAVLWKDVVPPCLPAVTGEKNSHETINYTLRIRQIWRRLELE